MITLVATVGICFLFELILSRPDLTAPALAGHVGALLENRMEQVETVEATVQEEEDPFVSGLEDQLHAKRPLASPLPAARTKSNIDESLNGGGHQSDQACLGERGDAPSRSGLAKLQKIRRGVGHRHDRAIDGHAHQAMEIRQDFPGDRGASLEEIMEHWHTDALSRVGDCPIFQGQPWKIPAQGAKPGDQPIEHAVVAQFAPEHEPEGQPHGQEGREDALALFVLAVLVQRFEDHWLEYAFENV